ncbi:MAG: alpha/beta hydrolase, partial [Deltaproteobacteria bacterium]|nr:alpha/beta hydrolase [Deltaproteobacteria bacterium]
ADYHGGTRRYPVIYFHDGQNLFEANTATFGAEWMVDEHYDELELERLIEPAIIVGIDNTEDRTREYVGDDTTVGDAKQAYTQWLIHSLKPYIDHHYRTRSQPDYTLVMGSSFGGIISFYQSWTHPEVFGHAGCVSTAFWRNGVALLAELEAYAGAKKPVRYWIDAGNEENAKDALGRSSYIDRNRRFAEKLVSLGWRENEDLGYLEVMNAKHDEQAWSRRIKSILYFLLRRQEPQLAQVVVRPFLEQLSVDEQTSVSVDLLYENGGRLTDVRADNFSGASLSVKTPALVNFDANTGIVTANASGTCILETHAELMQNTAEILIQ